MRMGLATFMPLKHGLAEHEPPEVVDLLRRIETGLEASTPISLQQLLIDVEALPPQAAQSRAARCLQGWILGELCQYSRALSVMNGLVAEWLAEVEGPNGPVAARWVVSIYSYVGLIYAAMGRDDQAALSFENARRLLQLVERTSAAPILVVDAAEEERLGQLDRIGLVPLLVDTMRFFEAVNDADGMARVANNIGHRYLDIGEPIQARHWLEHCVELLRDAGDLALAYALDSLGQCYRQLGQLGEARHLLEDALTRATRVEAPHVQACVLTGLADLERDEGHLDAALLLYGRARLLQERLRNRGGLAQVQRGVATLHRRAGQLAAALEAASEAEVLLGSTGAAGVRDLASVQALTAGVLMGRPDAAARLAEVVERLAARHSCREEVLGRWYLALAACRRGDTAEMRAQLDLALNSALRLGHLHLLAQELPIAPELLQMACEHRICPEGTTGLLRRVSSATLEALLHAAPAAAPLLKETGRLQEWQSLKVQLLGLFRVTRAGQEVDLKAARSQKAISLFKFLLVRRGQVTTREQILDTIWAGTDPDGSERSFQVTLSTLRKLLDLPDGPPVIVRRGQGYMLNPQIAFDVDVDRFLTHVKQGFWWWDRGQWELADEEWRRAEQEYGGDFLAEDPYEEWAIPQRERLLERYLDVLYRLAESALRRGHYTEVIERANQIVTADSLRESAYRLLMQAHAAMGERAMALRDYRRCAEVLKRELGEEPMAETRELAAQIWSAMRRGI